MKSVLTAKALALGRSTEALVGGAQVMSVAFGVGFIDIAVFAVR